MAVTAKTELVGLRDTVRALNKIEPGLRREFTQKASQLAEPAIREVQKNYVRVPLSGMERRWTDRGRRLFPFDLNRARRGVRLKVDAGRNTVAVISIEQRDPGTAVFESAGRATSNPLGESLGPLKPNHTRILGPSVFRRRNQITSEMDRLIRGMIDRVQREVDR